MNVRTPATSLVAALDEPWRFLRRDFARWAPPAFGIALLGVVPALLTQWFAASMYKAPGELDFVALGGVYAGGCGTLVTYLVSQLGAFVIAYRVLDGESPGFGEAILGALSPRLLVIGGSVLAFVVLGFGCLVGGPPLVGLLAFAPVVVLARPGCWFSAIGEAVAVSTTRTSPTDAGLPLWKLAAIGTVWYGVNAVASQLAALPTGGWTIWHLVSTLGQGNFADAMQMQAPFPVGATAALLGAALRPFGDVYLAAGAIILWRDIARVRAGQDLEALVGGQPA